MDCCDVRLFVQGVTLLVSLCIFTCAISFRIKYKFLPAGMIGVVVLVVHIISFYTFILLRGFAGFDIIGFLNEIVGREILSYGLWSSAIRLQTAIEILLMSLIIVRRHRWARSSLK